MGYDKPHMMKHGDRVSERATLPARPDQSFLHFRGRATVSQVKAMSTHHGVEKIGDTLFLDGYPAVQCGNPQCGLLIKLDRSYGEVRSQIVGGKAAAFGSEPGSREKTKVEFKPLKVTIGHWIRFEEMEVVDHKLCVVIKHRPSVHQVVGCRECYDKQQAEIADERAKEAIGAIDLKTGRPYRAKLVMYDDREG